MRPPRATALAIAALASAALVAALAAAGALACFAPPAPEDAAIAQPAIRPRVAAPEAALTFARLREGGGAPRIALVVGLEDDRVTIIDLPAGASGPQDDAFDIVRSLGRERLIGLARARGGGRDVPLAELLAAGEGEAQLATGLNFRDHADEVGLAEPFFFPKFGAATPPQTSLTWRAGMLLDYEVELCLRFDRPLRTVQDFDAAQKGFFLCGDFTDRARLMRLLPDEPSPSGIGFSDAKSGAGFFPTGPFLVIPADWRAFVAEERIATLVNGRLRQQAGGSDMALDFRAIAERAIADGARQAWRHEGRAVPLIEGGVLPRGAALMSGTPAGVIFRPPDLREIACGGAAYLCLGGFLRGGSLRSFVIERHVARLEAAGRHLKPGDVVRHLGAATGAITIDIRS